VRAESAGEGHGATFIVELPLMGESFRTSPSTTLRSGASDRLSGLTGLPGVNVLVLDDDADTRELLTAILHHAGAKAAAVSSAADALDVLHRGQVDVLISDIGLPEEDGCAFIRKVRDLSAERRAAIPAIAVTADARAETRLTALSAGFQLYMAKPIDPAELTAAIAQIIR
jgi:CheY-like chemotaxis protein